MHTTPTKRQLLTHTFSVLFIGVMLLFTVGCKVDNPLRPKMFFEDYTTEQVANFFRADVEIRAERMADQKVPAIISFRKPITTKRLLEIVKKHSLKMDVIHLSSGKDGGFANIRYGVGEPSLSDYLARLYSSRVRSTMKYIAEDEALCKQNSPDCYPKQIVEGKESLAQMQAEGEMMINAISFDQITAPLLRDIWNDIPEIFAIKIEDGTFVHGQPLYPDTDLSNWF